MRRWVGRLAGLATGLGLLTTGAVAAKPPADDPLVVDLSSHQVAITTGFSGTDLVLFGMVEPVRGGDLPDVVVVVRGPEAVQTLRRAAPAAGLWVTAGTARVVAPTFYRVAATRPLAQVAPAESLDRLGLGAERVAVGLEVEDDGADADSYWGALLRLKRARGLYGEGADPIGLPGRRLFRADIHLPASVAIGTYRAEVHLFHRGRLIATRATPLSVDRVGLGATIHDFAHRHAGIYGLGAVLLAALAGWLAALVFRRG